MFPIAIQRLKKTEGRVVEDWVKFKNEVMLYARRYGKERAAKNKKIISEIQKQIDQLIITQATWSERESLLYAEYSKQLETYYENATNKALFKSKISRIEQGEKCNKYFFGIQKMNYAASDILQIYDQNKKVTNDKGIVERVLTNYWGSLYTTKGQHPPQPLLEQYLKPVPKIDQEQYSHLDMQLAEEELKESVFSMKTGKSPGQDGITVAFYQFFWDDLSSVFTKVMEGIFEQGEVPDQMNVGIIRLLPKPRKDLLDVKSWRPICLQGVDIKIIAKALATKLQTVLDTVIHEDQVGFKAGSYIGQTIQMLNDIINYTTVHKVPGFIVSLDIEKAFDSVEWEYLDKTMVAFGLSPRFIKWVQILRRNTAIKILNNGWVTNPMNITKGLKQGDPLSPYLFLLSIEPFSIAIRQSKIIKGINIYDQIINCHNLQMILL